MGRFTNMVIFLIAVQAILTLVVGQAPADTPLWQLVTHPQTWSSSTFIISTIAIAAGIAAAGVVIGSIMGIKTDFMVFSAMIEGLLLLCVPIINLAIFIGAYASGIFCGAPGGVAVEFTSCPAAFWVVIVTGGTLGAYYLMTVIDWWRGRD